MKCLTCKGEGGITIENFNDPQSFECPDCKGSGEVPDESTAYGTDCKGGACE